jgi:uncharacterized protein YkwD
MPRLRLAAALPIACLAIFATASSAAADCPGADLLSAEQSEEQIEQSILCLINERRDGTGRPTVRVNSKLDSAAFKHSADMVSSGYFAHTSPAGVDFIDRIEATGYTRGARRWLVGENLVWGSSTLSTPAALVEAWMQSPPHRDNLLRGRFKEIGVAVVRGTPFNSDDADGVTVSSEYGFRGKRVKRYKR